MESSYISKFEIVYNNSPCLIFSTDGDWDEREDDFSDLEEIERLDVVVPPKDII